MEILIILGFAVVLLYFWLLGHWFARVLVFLVFAALFGLLGAGFTGVFGPPEQNHGWVGCLIGVALAWPTASVPTYYWRRMFATVHSEPPASR